jgi:monofunctional biosynthetic peptidoglycan transglycosylase
MKKTFIVFIAGILGSLALVGILMATVPKAALLKGKYPLSQYDAQTKTRTIILTSRIPDSWVHISQISPIAIRAILISEDAAFYEHDGFDPNEIRAALEDSIEAKRLTRGASTITQQVAKNVFLTNERSLLRKLRELIIAVDLEQTLSKNQILEIYLNVAEWGDGIYGVAQASRRYFGKSPALLGAKEGAFLAMLLPSPKKYSQSFYDQVLTPYARKTINTILHKLLLYKNLSDEDYIAEKERPLSFERSEAIEEAETPEPGREPEEPVDLNENHVDEQTSDHP